jgi:hypothetical protein
MMCLVENTEGWDDEDSLRLGLRSMLFGQHIPTLPTPADNLSHMDHLHPVTH